MDLRGFIGQQGSGFVCEVRACWVRRAFAHLCGHNRARRLKCISVELVDPVDVILSTVHSERRGVQQKAKGACMPISVTPAVDGGRGLVFRALWPSKGRWRHGWWGGKMKCKILQVHIAQ